jgi:hypothetical protein
MGFPFLYLRVLSAWKRMAPVAYWEASTSRMNCLVVSGGMRMGSDVTMLIKVSRAVVQLSVQMKLRFFFRRDVRGFVMSANPGMNWSLET